MGFIYQGIYYKNDNELLKVQSLKRDDNPTYKSWTHSDQRHTHAKEIIQPFDRHGKPNQQFIQAFPEESKERGFLPNNNDLKGK